MRVSSYHALACNVSLCTIHPVLSPHIRGTGTRWCTHVIGESVLVWSMAQRTRLDTPPCHGFVDVRFWRPRLHLSSSSCAFVSNVSGFGLAISRIHNRGISPPSIHLNNGNTPCVVGCGLCAGAVCFGYGLWVMGYGLWVMGYGLRAMGCGHGHGHGWAATCPKWHIDWRMKTLGHQICLRVHHYHPSICNGSLLARYATILHICCLHRWAMWYCTNAPFDYKVSLRNIRKP